MKKNTKLRIALCLTAGIMTLKATAVPKDGFSSEAWKLENGQYVDASGIPIEGALEKGITVSKYQNRQNESKVGIDWKKVAQDGISFAWCGSVISMTWIPIIP
uniref:hypothetical protein n=1 Tax=Clostridium sp. NkU-1 TaxID=1095009 RepID=UPI003261D1AB